MGCPHCEEYWKRRINTQFIINYQGLEYIIPEVELSTKVDDIDGGLVNIVEQTKQTQFTLKEQFKDEEPKLLQEEDTGRTNYFLTAYLLKTGALEDYRQKEKILQK